MSFFRELKRRNVFKVGIAYIVAAWLILQLADVLIDLLGLPDVIGKSIVLIIALGFPLTLLAAWAFELTPQGIKREAANNLQTQRQFYAKLQAFIYLGTICIGCTGFSARHSRNGASGMVLYL